MPDIHVRREHALGLTEARDVATRWIEEARTRLDLECEVARGEVADTVRFGRTGVSGTLVVAADHFELRARLGFLLGPFSRTIEAEIGRNLDTLLGRHGAGSGDGQAGQKERA